MNKQIKIVGVIYGILNCIILCGMDYSDILKDENLTEMREANYKVVGTRAFKTVSIMRFINQDFVDNQDSVDKMKLYKEVIVENNELDLLIKISRKKMGCAGVRTTFDLIGEHNNFLALEIGFFEQHLNELESSIQKNQDCVEEYINMPEIYTIKNIAAVSVNNEKLFTKAKRFNKNNSTFEDDKKKLIKTIEIFEHFYKEIKLLYVIQVLCGTLPLNLIKDLNAIDATERRLFAYIQPSFKNIVTNWNKLNKAEQKEFIALVIDFSNKQEVTLLIQKMHDINIMLSSN